MSTLTTTREVLDALGGAPAVAARLGVGDTTTYNWQVSERFPSRTYVALTAWLDECGHDAPPALWGMVELPAAGAPASAATERAA